MNRHDRKRLMERLEQTCLDILNDPQSKTEERALVLSSFAILEEGRKLSILTIVLAALTLVLILLTARLAH